MDDQRKRRGRRRKRSMPHDERQVVHIGRSQHMEEDKRVVVSKDEGDELRREDGVY